MTCRPGWTIHWSRTHPLPRSWRIPKIRRYNYRPAWRTFPPVSLSSNSSAGVPTTSIWLLLAIYSNCIPTCTRPLLEPLLLCFIQFNTLHLRMHSLCNTRHLRICKLTIITNQHHLVMAHTTSRRLFTVHTTGRRLFTAPTTSRRLRTTSTIKLSRHVLARDLLTAVKHQLMDTQIRVPLDPERMEGTERRDHRLLTVLPTNSTRSPSRATLLINLVRLWTSRLRSITARYRKGSDGLIISQTRL